jgi:hypothetical protein
VLLRGFRPYGGNELEEPLLRPLEQNVGVFVHEDEPVAAQPDQDYSGGLGARAAQADGRGQSRPADVEHQ